MKIRLEYYLRFSIDYVLNITSTKTSTMKTVAALALLAGSAAAFAPTAKVSSSTALKASDYESMIGVDVETGKKFVSF